ncbi:hemerythrin domain-containing protein [Pigmentibacter sp. JX0631]|uniref:hemerythrin domain-containing protein n=1 Tax=Pigmentibacter sp. JX0631 TaxID=2976982 RepID=UPI0024699C3F|nr:hemerythrin domain-containing protein [Pigmentibacter sp. JX0631]WGL59772.1 hemerythrin domain-containing protein [Pigmentibacter sp. JX0631]
MDIIKKLINDHHNALALIEKLEKRTQKNDDKTQELVQKLYDEISLHAKSEEKALYKMCEKKNIKLRDIVLEGKIEHSLITRLLEKLISTTPGEDGKFKAILFVLKELLEHHALCDEEEELFPQIKKYFTERELIEMGKFFDDYKEELTVQ